MNDPIEITVRPDELSWLDLKRLRGEVLAHPDKIATAIAPYLLELTAAGRTGILASDAVGLLVAEREELKRKLAEAEKVLGELRSFLTDEMRPFLVNNFAWIVDDDSLIEVDEELTPAGKLGEQIDALVESVHFALAARLISKTPPTPADEQWARDEVPDARALMPREQWNAELVRIAQAEFSALYTDPIRDCGADAWDGYYESGRSPRDALFEDSAYTEEDADEVKGGAQ